MKKAERILKQAGIKDWMESLKNTVTDTLTDSPKIPQKDEATLKKFREQSGILYDQLIEIIKDMQKLEMEGDWHLKGEGGKTTLENAVENLKNFNTALNAKYTVTHDEPGKDIK